MLLNYLYNNFLEEAAFAQACGVSSTVIASLQEAGVIPKASYVYESRAHATSFVSDFQDEHTYRFYLNGHVAWFEAVRRLGLDSEERARAYFIQRYTGARYVFLSSELGQELAAQAPQIPETFDDDLIGTTWGHFLNGVYGVCTRDGQPETIFLKQAGVRFIEYLTKDGPAALSASQLELLKRIIVFLDDVESNFAPHEVKKSSRQRCIIDVKAAFFDVSARDGQLLA